MKRSSFFSILIAGVVVLLIGIGGYWLRSQSQLTLLQGGTQATPQAAMFVPKQAPVMASILVNPDRLESLVQAVARSKERRNTRMELNQLKTSLLANSGLDYRRDIQPWLGDEISLAITSQDIDRDASNGRQPGYLMALATRKPERSREFLELFFSKRAIAGTDLVSEQYKGVQLLYNNSRPQLGEKNAFEPSSTKNAGMLTGAIVGDNFVLFANHPKVLKDALNNVQAPDLSLTTSSQYQQALTLLPPQRIGVTFLNFPSRAASSELEPAQTYQTQIVALELNRQGLLAETTILGTPKQEVSTQAPALSQPVKALQYIPAATGFSISGSDLSRLENTDLNQLWTKVSAGLFSLGDALISQLVNQPLADLQARWGIDLPKDIFSWVQGEYALGLLPRSDSSNPDWIFVAEKSDATLAGISHLDAIAQSKGLSITALNEGNQKITAWTQLTSVPNTSSDADRQTIALKAKVEGVHAEVGNYEVLTSSVEAMNEALRASQIGSLVDNPKFKASIDTIPQPNQGYVYLDWTATQGILERQLPIVKLLEVVGKPFFSNLRSLTISNYGSETEFLKGGVFFQFSPQSTKTAQAPTKPKSAS